MEKHQIETLDENESLDMSAVSHTVTNNHAQAAYSLLPLGTNADQDSLRLQHITPLSSASASRRAVLCPWWG